MHNWEYLMETFLIEMFKNRLHFAWKACVAPVAKSKCSLTLVLLDPVSEWIVRLDRTTFQSIENILTVGIVCHQSIPLFELPLYKCGP